jgi:phosphatidylserine/phosphatidylglycerophosphate/cardiolipin synthase-like enzyme
MGQIRCTAMAVLLVLGLVLTLPAVPALAGTDHAGSTTLLANREYAPALIDGIREARRSVVCCFYLFKIGTSRKDQPRRIAEELIAARRRGVEVTVILENQGKRRDRLDAGNHATANFLVSGGVKVFFDSPNVTTHSKVAVIDDRYVFLGSHNLSQGALTRNNELSLLVDSPELATEVLARLKRL